MRCLLVCVAAIVVVAAFPGTSAAKGVAHVEVIYGTHFRHNDRETIFISHNGFFPPAICRKKVKFWLYDGPGKKFYLGKKKAYTKPDYFVKQLPDGAKSGRGKIKGKQNCGRIRGTASDTDRITIAATGPAPKLKSDRIVGGASGEKVTDQVNIDLTKWDYHFITVRVEYELFPDVWQQVAVLGRDQLIQKPGGYEVPWRAKVGGKPAPAGTYRFVFEFFRNEFGAALGESPRSTDTTEFQVHEVLGQTELTEPTDGKVNPAGEVVVADTSHNRLAVFDEAGRLVRDHGGDEAQLSGPKDVSFSSGGYQYVADTGNKRITVLAPTGQRVTTFGESLYTFAGPVGIDVTMTNGGRVYVVDGRGDPCVRIYDLNGSHVADVNHDPCNSPGDVAAAADGSMWVADNGANQLFHFGPDGAFLGTATRTVTGAVVPLGIGYQTSVDVAADGRLYLAARLSSPPVEIGGIVILTANGSYMDHYADDDIGYIVGVVAAGLAGDFYITRRQGETLRFRP
ncbi:MAG: NHL repeat-containing protein [Thermoleophilaceae bacterium]